MIQYCIGRAGSGSIKKKMLKMLKFFEYDWALNWHSFAFPQRCVLYANKKLKEAWWVIHAQGN